MRPALTLAAALLCALPLTGQARADTAISLGVYLWTDTEQPSKAQFISVADTHTEIEIDTPDGSRTTAHPTTDQETRLLTAAVEDQMKALSLSAPPQPKVPYVTVEWRFQTDTSSGDGTATYARDKVPEAVRTLQQAVFGGTYDQ